ncbi:tRNA lysidine(34) synthetase TilS [Belliella marina]|uniref:tRNA(Ile)-lysidine synthase n=1 Tax=Belliella marina TaxID=1644146 RepID=A0ABW4VHG8_9BACT
MDLNGHYLLAISGGVDSVCLGHLLHAAGVRFSLAHFNFGLRDQESDGDELFVREMAAFWDVSLFVNKANKEEFEVVGKSVQMVARDLRYQWFEDLVDENQYTGVMVAHHFEDQLETILLNMLRGTGIEGLYGMAEKRGFLIRPLLPFKRSEIEEFMVENKLHWRIDSSNKKNVYKRNFLRNEVIPLLLQGFPDGLMTLDDTFQRLKDTGKAFFHLFSEWKSENIKEEGTFQYLDIASVKNLPGRHSMLYYWLRDYGFGYADVVEIYGAIEKAGSGKVFYAGKYMVNVDREMIILGEYDLGQKELKIEETDISLSVKSGKYDILQVDAPIEIDRDANNAMFDLEKLKFPLTVRNWEIGDKFVPLGMKNEKKVSDLLIDLKVPVIQKRSVSVLCSGNEIAWVVGYRISEHYKSDANTKKVMYFKKR